MLALSLTIAHRASLCIFCTCWLSTIQFISFWTRESCQLLLTNWLAQLQKGKKFPRLIQKNIHVPLTLISLLSPVIYVFWSFLYRGGKMSVDGAMQLCHNSFLHFGPSLSRQFASIKWHMYLHIKVCTCCEKVAWNYVDPGGESSNWWMLAWPSLKNVWFSIIYASMFVPPVHLCLWSLHSHSAALTCRSSWWTPRDKPLGWGSCRSA